MRKWRSEDYIATEILTYYTASFFLDAYGIPENRTYDFIMLCIETQILRKILKLKITTVYSPSLRRNFQTMCTS